MLLRENTMEASFFHFSLLHPTVTLSANPAGLSPKIYSQTSPAFDYTAGQNCCHFPLHYYIHLLTTLFAYAFVLTKSMVHTVIWVIILKTKTAISLLSWVAIAFSCPILLKIKIQRPYNDLALLSPVYLLSLITSPFCSLNNSTLQPHLCTECSYGICTGRFFLSLSEFFLYYYLLRDLSQITPYKTTSSI